MSAQVQPAVSSLPPVQTAKLWQAAQDFEAMAIGQLLQPMFQTVDSAHSAFGGGEAEAARSGASRPHRSALSAPLKRGRKEDHQQPTLPSSGG